MAVWNSTTPAGYILRLEVTVESQSIANNTSTLDYSLKLIPQTSFHNDFNNNTSTASVTISGASKSWSGTYNFSNGATKTLVSGTTTRTHNADGTLSVSVSGTFNDAGTGVGDDTVSDSSWALPTIPRASNPSYSASSIAAGGTQVITTNRASTAFTHDITYKFGTKTGTVATGVGASFSWAIPMDILTGIPNATSGTATITTVTKNGGSTVGTHTDSFTITVPASVVPTVSDITWSEANADVAAVVGAGNYVQNQSKLNVNVIADTNNAYGSTIANYQVTVAGQSIQAASGTTPGVISASGSVPIVATVTDSRGRTATRTENVTILPWAAPVITAFSLQRATSTGVVSETGTYVRVNLTDSISALTVGGVQKNSHTLRLWSRARGATTWTDKGTTSVGGASYNGYILASTYPVETSFEFKVDVVDRFTTSSATGTTATATIFMHWADNGLGIGKFWERGSLDVAGSLYIENGARVTPITRASIGTGTDWNTLTTPGIYEVAGRGANAPAAYDYGILEVWAHTNGATLQRYISHGGPRATYERIKYVSGSTWNTWETYYPIGILPNPSRMSSASAQTITSTTLANLPTTNVETSISLSVPALCLVTATGMIGGGDPGTPSSQGTLSFKLTGAVTYTPALNDRALAGITPAVSAGGTLTRYEIFPAGTTTATIQANRHTNNNIIMRGFEISIIPIRAV